MNRERAITQEAFDGLLEWLDRDRERAGAKYEEIRRRLVKIFACRGCHEAEELADETINRVTLKAREVAPQYVGDPSLYFYAVANRVRLEYLRRRPAAAPDPPPRPTEEREREHACLEECFARLAPEQREMIVEYYREDRGAAKVERRRRLAERLGVALNALRIRAHRVRARDAFEHAVVERGADAL
jgi:DNA-directed RNA polymerase specialized sigma24 family protein